VEEIFVVGTEPKVLVATSTFADLAKKQEVQALQEANRPAGQIF
jgi:hypothetical protein